MKTNMDLNFFGGFGAVDKESEIFIQSNKKDRSTDDIIMWLYYFKKGNYINCFFDDYIINKLNIELSNEKKVININNSYILENSNFLYRRGFFSLNFNNRTNILEDKLFTNTIEPILNYLKSNFIKNQINNFHDNITEKLEILNLCIELKINIPDVLITSENLKLFDFVKKHKKVITKPVKNPFFNFEIENKMINFSTASILLTPKDLKKKANDFLPSFFQKYIEKKYEIRSFYLDGQFMSMAIFSQQNDKTKVDFRNYDYNRPNRCVPYKLPNNIEVKLRKLMGKINMRSGSFDIIVTPNNKYYFLEVNPIGQFQWLSRNCNYQIERKIAEKLI